MSIEAIRNSLPDNAKDIKLNLANVLTEEGASDLALNQIFGIALAAAYAAKNQIMIAALLADPHSPLSDNEISAAKSAAIIMAMNNVYYRFTHLVNDSAFASLPAKLRMNVLGNPEINKIDFEPYCLAVSAINGCGKCIEAHTHELVKANLSKLAIQSAIRIAAVINAAAFSFDIAV